MSNTIQHTSTDDERPTGGGLTYWFSIGDEIFGLCRGWPSIGTDEVIADYWVDADDVPMYYPYEQIAPGDQRAAAAMVPA